MNPLLSTARHLLLGMACLLSLAAQAEPITLFVPFAGAGNVAVFDAATGSGGWVGAIDQSPDSISPATPAPLSLISVVLFTLDAASRTLSGSFEFTTTDLLSTLYGELSGSVLDADILGTGGQFSVDYLIRGGSGQFFGASGFGLSFVDFNPAPAFNNYAEAGLLAFSVPEPGSLALVSLGLLAFAWRRRARQAS